MGDNSVESRSETEQPGESWSDGYWWSRDGLRLHYRDYGGRDDLPPVICLPGLTRNARDFETLAAHIAPGRRVICPEYRGRGDSAYAKDVMSYVPLSYAQDVEALLQELEITRFALIGTSLGGIVSMLLASTWPGRIEGVVLNDIGPEIAPDGLKRIQSYVGEGRSFESWAHAGRAQEELNGAIYPDWQLSDWIRFAKRTYKLTSKGRIVQDYDTRIAEPFEVPGSATGVDLWPALRAMADVPVLIVRGETSDILSADVAARMLSMLRKGRLETVAAIGHAPTLDEAEAVRAIDGFLADIAAQPAAL